MNNVCSTQLRSEMSQSIIADNYVGCNFYLTLSFISPETGISDINNGYTPALLPYKTLFFIHEKNYSC